MDVLAENYKRICFGISEAAARYRGSDERIRLMAVTKTVPPELVNRSIELGIDLIGENRVQEYLSKKDMYKPCEMHIIGHLQSNKVKYIINDASMIQSVDSLKLAEEIDRLALKNKRIMDVLVEVNIGMEQSKTGVMPDRLEELILSVEQLGNIRLRGLMAIPPAGCPEQTFEDVRELFEKYRKHRNDKGFDTLSMGMSGDYELAIKHGSTLVRLGTALYGARIYK